ncbi:MAG: hypothetical protein KAT35_01775 [Candidatus Aenigmarchaeota archaeon]|nr:hypothetical protein [Candidatus Aenigmarchaeota archaeon]
MEVRISINDKSAVILLTGIVIIASIGIGLAAPPDPGHSIGEVDFSGGFTVPDGDVIVSTGRIGIGTSDPAQKLDVNGNVDVSGDVDVNGNVSANDYYIAKTGEWASTLRTLSCTSVCVACGYVTSPGTCVADCPSGYTVTGGGVGSPHEDYSQTYSIPYGNGWSCWSYPGKHNEPCCARCCKIQ